MTYEPLIQQKLYKHQALDRFLCASCNDTNHKHCEGYECSCPCRDPRPPRVRVRRDKNGLSREERESQKDLRFDDDAPFTVSAAPLSLQHPNSVNTNRAISKFNEESKPNETHLPEEI